jgi:hypothetical protein
MKHCLAINDIYRITVDMMDNERALPTCPQQQQQSADL